MDLIYKQEAYDIIGAAMEVYRDKGHGFAEQVYQECLELELAHRGIPFHAQREIRLAYRGHTLKHSYFPDLVCHEQIIVELKAVKELADEQPGPVAELSEGHELSTRLAGQLRSPSRSAVGTICSLSPRTTRKDTKKERA